MKEIGILIFTLVISSAVNAGVNGLTIHSRANCGNNESISWDLTTEWYLNTKSTHILKNEKHIITTGWQYTWRSAAVCWFEASKNAGWTVKGEHYIAYKQGDMIPLGSETVKNCSLYDGWWDENY